jgi:hypothetical protein
MKRRSFITLLGGAAAAWPLVLRGQEPGRIYRLGCLLTSPRDAPHYVALFDELRRLGFIEGQNLVVDAAGYGLPPERMEVHAADLMSGPVDAVVAAGDPAVRAAQRATTSIPILSFTDDMVGQGFVNSGLVGNPAGASVSIKALELRCPPSDRVRNGSLSAIGSSCQIAKFSSSQACIVLGAAGAGTGEIQLNCSLAVLEWRVK